MTNNQQRQLNKIISAQFELLGSELDPDAGAGTQTLKGAVDYLANKFASDEACEAFCQKVKQRRAELEGE